MNNRHLDSSSKEEVKLMTIHYVVLYFCADMRLNHLQLQIFYNQLCNGPTELSIYNIFTLNNNLITSVSNYFEL